MQGENTSVSGGDATYALYTEPESESEPVS